MSDIGKNLQLGDLETDIFKFCNIDRPFMIKMISNLKPEYFQSVINSKIFESYKECFEKYNQAPTRKVLELQLEKKGESRDRVSPNLDRIFGGQAQFDPVERDHITNEVVTFAKKARMVDAINQSIEFLEKDDFESILTVTKDALLFNIDIQRGYDLYDVDARYKNLQNSLMNKIPTGFSQIDQVLDGGWAKKEIYCVMGPPGFGKSIFLPNFGIKALLNGQNVVHYSLEMSEDRIGQRYDAIASGINQRQLMDHPDEVKEKYDMFKKITKSRLKLKEFPTSMASVLDIEAHLDNLRTFDNFEPDIIIVDYGDIMKSTRNTKNTYEEQGWIFRELRGLAIKRNVVIITATQTTRDSLSSDGGTAEIIGMDKAADSMEKNRILDVLFSITQSMKDKDDGVINLWVAKNRNGQSSKFLEFMINYKNFQIKEQAALGKKGTTEVSDSTKELANALSMDLEDEKKN